MAKALTEASTYTASITVPEGTDSRSNAANVVEALAQGLADRTKWIKDNKAELAAANTFTAQNTFSSGPIVADDDSGVAALSSPVQPGDAGSGNKYLLRAQFQIDGSKTANLYVGGAAGTQGQLVLTVNASWDIGTQKWHQQSSGSKSTALFVEFGKLFVGYQAAGTGTDWSSWPTGVGKFEAGDANVYDVNADHDVNANNDVTAANDVIAGADVKAVGNFLYSSAKNRTIAIPLQSFTPDPTFVTYGQDGISLGASVILNAPIRLPSSAVINTVEVLVSPSGANAMTLRAHKRETTDWATPSSTAGTTVDTATSSGTSLQVLSVDFGGLSISEVKEYWISVASGQASDRIWAARIVNWTDPGPRNN